MEPTSPHQWSQFSFRISKIQFLVAFFQQCFDNAFWGYSDQCQSPYQLQSGCFQTTLTCPASFDTQKIWFLLWYSHQNLEPKTWLYGLSLAHFMSIFHRFWVWVFACVQPSGEETENRRVYAQNVRALMAEKLGIPMVDRSVSEFIQKTSNKNWDWNFIII